MICSQNKCKEEGTHWIRGGVYCFDHTSHGVFRGKDGVYLPEKKWKVK